MEIELTRSSPLLDATGKLNQVGWARHPILDGNLEAARFYPLRAAQRFRMKRWDYYAVFTPSRFFSATIADLGYAGNLFVYSLDFRTNFLHEEGLVIPLSQGVSLPRDPRSGESHFADRRARLNFRVQAGLRRVEVDWPGYNDGQGLKAEITLHQPESHESMNIVIPIGRRRFYYNHKINCLPAEGSLQIGQERESLDPATCLGQLDWGRGVWEYRSFWNWASASGFLGDGRTIGLNLGCGFGDTSQATENCFILDGRLHKLGPVGFDYHSGSYLEPWRFTDDHGRLELVFTPFKERLARTNLGLIFSEVHQMFGRYSGWAITSQGEKIEIRELVGFAEEHQARW